MKTLHIVLGTSMEPLYKSGQMCIIQDIKESELQESCVACFERFGQKIIHRLILLRKVNGKQIIVEKGDNYPIASIIDVSTIRGVVADQQSVGRERFAKIRFRYVLIRVSVSFWERFFKKQPQKHKVLLRYILWEYVFLWVIPTILFNHIKDIKKNVHLLKTRYTQFARMKRRERLFLFNMKFRVDSEERGCKHEKMDETRNKGRN